MIEPVKANAVSNPQACAGGGSEEFGPWNPGVQSQVPREWCTLATLFRPENAFADLAAVEELAALTGLAASELVAFRPQRLALHELLIRITADFVVPDGSRIGDLGINFRRIASDIWTGCVAPQMSAIEQTFEAARHRSGDVVTEVFSELTRLGPQDRAPRAPRRWLEGLMGRRPPAAPSLAAGAGAPISGAAWGAEQIAECERRAASAADALTRCALRSLARVMAGLFTTHGRGWGTAQLIASLARNMACNEVASDAIGELIEPWLRQAAGERGYGLLPPQQLPIVINTKGPSASGKSTLRPLQKRLAGDIGATWSEFALISPDIWRKQLLDYAGLGPAYKYAGALAAEELAIVDRKLDRYMARKHAQGRMSHLLIDRFRFDSFAPDSDEEGSNLLTRFAQRAYLFFVITPPELLVERAWKRGLEFGRYKAVDDTLAHSVEAYAGIPNVFFTWIRRGDKRIQFEFLDNTVAFGERPRTVAFGDNETVNVLDVGRMLDVNRYGRVFVDATGPAELYRDRSLLAPEHNLDFLERCVREFRRVNFVAQASGRVYLRMQRAAPVLCDAEGLQEALRDPDTRAGLQAVAAAALEGRVPAAGRPTYLRRHQGADSPQDVRARLAERVPEGAERDLTTEPVVTLGRWGEKAPAEA